MAWLDRLGRLPSSTLNWAAGLTSMAGLFALGVGIGTGWTLLLVAAYAVIFLAALVPSAVELRDSKPRREATIRPASAPAARGWHAPASAVETIERDTGGGRLVWFEPEPGRHRLH